MDVLQRPGRLMQGVGGVLTVVGLAGFLLAPDVGEVLYGFGGSMLQPASPVLLWGLAKTTSALLLVVGLVVLAFGAGYSLAARELGRPAG